MKTIIISPYSRVPRSGVLAAKDYPYWTELVDLLHTVPYYTIQVGLAGEELIGAKETKFDLELVDLEALVKASDTWISVDNFFPHMCSHLHKIGVVIWGISDPLIFGAYKTNVNLLKSRENLRVPKQVPGKNMWIGGQFGLWDDEPYDPTVFVKPAEVLQAVQKVLS